MKGILRNVLLIPGDHVYIIISLKRKVVIKAKIRKVEIDEDEVWYRVYSGVVKCEKESSYKVGHTVQRLFCFNNSHIDTGLNMTDKASGYVFTTKDRCIEFLKGK